MLWAPLTVAPFNTEVVYALGAALKWRKYRTADIYLYLARATAEREGATIDAATRRAVTDVIRSCKRGRGPAKRCEGLVLEILPSLPATPKAWADGGPWRPRNALIIGSWWMLREIEFSGAELRSVTFNTVLKSASLTLPASKADPTALGETVSHGCLCRDGSNPLCPYHLLLKHMVAYYRKYPKRFDHNGWPKAGFPLFPDKDGNVCTKDGVTLTIRLAARLLGQHLVDPGGLYLHTGHALRVTGAQALARAGLSEHTISLLARWGSSAVLKYIRKAPLAASHHLAAVALLGWERNASSGSAAPVMQASLHSTPRPTKAKTSRLKKAGRAAMAAATSKRSRAASRARLTAVEAHVADLRAWRTSFIDAMPETAVEPAPVPDDEVPKHWDGVNRSFPYVSSIRGRCHQVAVGHPEPPWNWVTRCGWPFGISDVARPVYKLPTCYKLMCERCLRVERGAARGGAESLVLEVGVAAQ